jgi:hypothetical protein
MTENNQIKNFCAAPSGVEKALLHHLEMGSSDLLNRVRNFNSIILHNYQVSVEKQLCCALEGCNKEFNIALIPGQILYPKYCAHHRTPHRRQHFIKGLEKSQA